ncbi:hypothetical protein D3H65_26190 [Paraflavitalea soli]|uniref:Uncharacterized protein n=1 Tax=Paraflavitalea soli TaxID=2315862 RepID=A0A3B7MVK1_9BACT|nr:hypothetical protein [Paraflavitalea soli]AXY77259.1 hypothetical protein D3H65_26190 [Paraflavitalea soli]
MKLFPALLVILFITACKDNSSQSAANTPAAGKDSTVTDSTLAYLPIIELIRQDLRHVDSFAGGILKKTTINGKKDSLFIKPAVFHQLAAAFLMPELETTTFRQKFTESSLADESTGQLQFIYTPNDPALALRNVVAYITPSTSSSGDQVSRFYLEKEWAAGDTTIQQKLTWKTRQYFYIVTIRQPKKGPAITSIEKLIWDPEQFGE